MKAASIATILASTMVLGAGAALPAAAAQEEGPKAAAHEAGEILDRLARYLESLDSFEFDCSMISESVGDGLLMRYESRYSASIRRPGHIALRHEGGMVAPTFVSDGQMLHTYLPTINKYTKGPAPTRPENLLAESGDEFGFFEHVSQTPGLRTLLSADPVAVLNALKADAESLGVEQINGVQAHRIRIDRAPRTADLWIAAGDTPWLVRAELESPDDEWGAAGFWKDVRSSQILMVSNWRTPERIDDERFAFAPPQGAEEVDDLMAAMMDDWDFGGGFDMEGEAHALLGQPAPDFEIETLDGPAGSLSDLSAQGRVVVLDFWATWCPPCREGLPIIAEVMSDYPQDKAIFYAVNVQENRATIQRFLESQNLNIHVALDPDGAIAQQYGVSGIPQTVIIGKDGAVEAVHVGLSPDLNERLKREIDAVLAGEKLSEAAPQPPAAAELPEEENLEILWQLAGGWAAVAVDQSNSRIHLVAAGGRRLATASPDGELQRDVRASLPPSAGICVARLQQGEDAATIAFQQPWGRSVEAFDAEGTRLWAYTVGQGVNDIWTADLTGDGLDEIIVGYNGATGLHALSSDGKLLWRDTSIGNVWHVTAGDITGDGRPEVITTSAVGQVHVFDAEGARLRNLPGPRGMYAWIVRAVPATADRQAMIFAGGSGPAGHNRSVAAMDANGATLWSVEIPGQVMTMSASPSGRWLAVGCEGGSALVLDTAGGSIAAHRSVRGARPDVAWLATDSGETLLTASGREVTAARVSGSE